LCSSHPAHKKRQCGVHGQGLAPQRPRVERRSIPGQVAGKNDFYIEKGGEPRVKRSFCHVVPQLARGVSQSGPASWGYGSGQHSINTAYGWPRSSRRSRPKPAAKQEKGPLVRKSATTPQGRASDERGDAEQMLAITPREGSPSRRPSSGRSTSIDRQWGCVLRCPWTRTTRGRCGNEQASASTPSTRSEGAHRAATWACTRRAGSCSSMSRSKPTDLGDVKGGDAELHE